MRVLTNEDVTALLTIDDVIAAVREAYRQLGSDVATDAPRENVYSTVLEGNLKAMPAVSEGGLGGSFYTGGFSGRPDDVCTKLGVLFDARHGELRCVAELGKLSWLRTGATSGVATDCCAREDASTVGLVGSGKQARSQLLAVAAVRDIEAVRVFSPTRDHREAFAAEMQAALEVPVAPVDSAREAVSGPDIVCTATTAPDPVIDGDWLEPGTHLNAIGAHYPDQREVDTRTVERATVVVDSLARARKEEGELLIPVDEGAFDWADATELGDIVCGSAPGRTGDDEITFMTSGGLAIEGLLSLQALDDRAADADRGVSVGLAPAEPLL